MRHSLFSMIATGSLAAFSAANLAGLTPVRNTPATGPASRAGAAASRRLIGDTHQDRPLRMLALAPGEVLPRGSLLDLLV